MEKKRIDLSKITQIRVAACPGNLLARGGGSTAVTVQGDPFEMSEADNELTISGEGDLRLNLPPHVDLTIPHVAGDASLKRLQGAVNIHQIDGDAALSGLSQVKLGRVAGDLAARRLNGSLSVEEVAGDAVIRNAFDVNVAVVRGDCLLQNLDGAAQIGEVFGDLSLRRVTGDVDIGKVQRDVMVRDLEGDAQVGHAAGDVRLYGVLHGDTYTFQADGDIVLRWPGDAPLHLTAQAPAITNRLSLEEATETEEMVQGHIGKGGAAVSLTASGHIILKPGDSPTLGPDLEQIFEMEDLEAEMADVSQRIAKEVNEHVAQITNELETRFGDQWTRKMEKIARKAERAAEKARRRVERQATRHGRGRGWGGSHHTGRHSHTRARAKEPAREATAEEQMKILKMVEKGAISPEEANTLLEALEG